MKSDRLLLLTILAGIASCTLHKEYPIDIYKPGEVTLPEELADVSLISRNFRYTKDTLQDYYLSDGRLISLFRVGFSTASTLTLSMLCKSSRSSFSRSPIRAASRTTKPGTVTDVTPFRQLAVFGKCMINSRIIGTGYKSEGNDQDEKQYFLHSLTI